jgi:hypothetical protein
MKPDHTNQTSRTGPSVAANPLDSPERIDICTYCGGGFVYPLDWAEDGPKHWQITLRCPDCEHVETGVFGQSVVEHLDNELDRASAELLSDLRRITHANMTEEADFFIRALNADVIVPSDF